MTPTLPQGTPENDRLVSLVAQIATHDGDFATDIPALSLYRRSKPSDPVHCMYGLGITAAVQSRKRLIVGDETIEYGAGQSLLTTVDLPVVSHIFEASMAEPYLGLLLTLDPKLIAQLAADMHFPLTSKEESRRAVSCHTMDAGLHDAVCRLIALLHEPEALHTQLAPLIQREICVRLLLGAHGAKLRHIVATGSPAQQIARTVTWIKQNFHQPIDIEALAAQAHMSPSTFRVHFGAVCGIAPAIHQADPPAGSQANAVDTAARCRGCGAPGGL